MAMTLPRDAAVPDELRRSLARLRAHVRLVRMLRGLGVLAVVLVVGFWLALQLDYWADLAGPTRVGLLVGLGVAGIVVGVWVVLRPLLRTWSEAELAAIVERAYPNLHERFSSTVELNDPAVPEAHRGSALMRSLLTRQTVQSVQAIDVRESVPHRRPLVWMVAGLTAVFLLLAPFIVSPSWYALRWQRYFSPLANLDSPGRLAFEVEGGDRVVARGTDVTITARCRWRDSDQSAQPEAVWLTRTDSAGGRDTLRMEFDAKEKIWSAAVPRVLQPFEFQVSADEGRSRTYRIGVVDAPEVHAVTLNVEPPPYTGLPAQTIDGAVGEVTVFTGSRLRFDLTFNKPITDVALVWLDQPLAAKRSSEGSIPLTLSEDGRSASLEFVATHGGPFAFRLTDEHGLHNGPEPQRVLIVTPDQPPTLQLSGSNRPQDVRPDEVLSLPATATDDTGLSALELHYRVEGRPGEFLVETEAQELGVRQLERTFSLALEPLALSEGAVVVYRVRAADERPEPGPNEVWSDERRLTIRRDADPAGTADLAERQQQLRDTLRKIREEVAESRAQVEDIRQEAEDDQLMQLEFQRDAEFAPLAGRQRELARRLDAVASEFADHPLYANLTPAARQVAREQLEPAAEDLKTARSQPLAEKIPTLDQAQSKLADAEQALAELEQTFDTLAELERDLLELDRLAREAEELADEALTLEREMRNVPENETPEQRARREADQEQRRQELAGRQEQLAQDLSGLLERRPELLEAAREKQLDRLRQLAERLKELTEPQEQLAEALREDAEQLSEQTAALAERQEQLLQDAERLPKPTDAVAPLDPAALRKSLEELKAGNLSEARQSQDAAAEELDRFAEALQAPPADPARQAEQLAKEQQIAAGQARAQSDAGRAPDAAERDAALERLTRRREAAERLPVGETFPEEHKDAVEQLRKAAAAQQKLSQAAAKNEPSPAADAEEQLEQLMKQNAQAQQDAADALRRLSDALSDEAAKEQLAEMQEQQRRANEQTAAEAESLADRQRKLAEETAALQQENAAAADNPADVAAHEPMSSENPPQEQRASQNESAENQPSTPQPSAAQQALDRQAELAQEAARLALETARQQGAESPAAQTAVEMAEQSDQTHRQLQGGQLDQAGQRGEDTAQTAERLADQLADGQPDLSQQARDFARRQREQAEQFDRMAQSRPDRAESRQAAQTSLADEAEQLSRQLSDAAERMSSDPLNLDPQGEQTEAAGESTRQAEQQMRRTAQQVGQCNCGSARGSSEQALNSLRQAYEQAMRAAGSQDGRPSSPVPGEIADQIVQAAKRLNEAREQLARSEQNPPQDAPPSNQNGESASTEPGRADPDQTGPTRPGSESQAQGQPQQATGQNGRPGTPLEQTAESLREAADALNQVAGQLQAGQRPGSQSASNGQTGSPQSAQEGAAGNNGEGGVQGVDLGTLQLELDKMTSRQWGQLPGRLKTEILQAAQRNPNSDYAKLIKLYFEEIARTKPAPATEETD
ncbi:MAG: hypothetical protein ACREJB_09205 [Planctomycetaceae bacterium]